MPNYSIDYYNSRGRVEFSEQVEEPDRISAHNYALARINHELEGILYHEVTRIQD